MKKADKKEHVISSSEERICTVKKAGIHQHGFIEARDLQAMTSTSKT